MFYQKMTREEKQKLYESYIRTRNELEYDPTVIAWKEWSKKPESEQLAEIKEWNEYYSKVKESVIYEMYMKQRDYASKGNYAGVKEIADQVKEMRKNNLHITTDEPKFTDPWEYRHNPNISAYLKAQEEIKSMSDYTGTDEIFA